ncbi:hypothetical protein TNCV_1796091 [Trichonephila clavipes]|nr:hypothetical protein TNCV_1796091 [Trichonephila clavipes]
MTSNPFRGCGSPVVKHAENTEKEPTHVSIETHHAVPVRAVQQRDDFANQMLTMIDSEGFDVGYLVLQMKHTST